MRGWVCVGAMAGFEVQVWWEGGHIQIPSTCMGPPIPQHCCGDGCAGSLMAYNAFPLSTFPACLHTFP